MDSKQLEEAARLHHAGAIIRHKSPFAELPSHANDSPLSKEFIDKWVVPFYMRIGEVTNDWIDLLISIKGDITEDIIQRNLGDFNWRTRQTGAFFAAITNRSQFIDVIGIHLLKSEVCYAGKVYCCVLASFNTPRCIEYLNKYLNYYLTKPHLPFDQQDAMEAILYLDKVNGTTHYNEHQSQWIEFTQNKSRWEETATDRLEQQLAVIEAVRNHMSL